MMEKSLGVTPDQLDMDLMAETELARLQKQYRVMENERKAFMEDSNRKLAKQRIILSGLRREKANLETDIKVATCPNQMRKIAKIRSEAQKLVARVAELDATLDREKKRLEEIEQQIKKTEKEASRLRLEEITDRQYEDRIKSAHKSARTLENKLGTTTRRFCAILTENRHLREEIDHLLKEREQFNAISERLLTDLAIGKKFMLDLIEQATNAYDQREEWCNKLQALRIRSHNDLLAHTQDLKEMQRQLDHDGKLREFLLVKGQRRVMRDLEDKETRRRQLEAEEAERLLEVHRKSLGQIQEFCQEEDVERIAAKYLKQEEENFALFNYVNELNQDLENLNETIKELNQRIEEHRQEADDRTKGRLVGFADLQRELKECQGVQQLEEGKLRDTEEELRLVLEGVKKICDLLGCDYTPILDLLGEESDVSEANVMIYLGLIEKRVSTLITDTYFKEKSLMKSKKSRTK